MPARVTIEPHDGGPVEVRGVGRSGCEVFRSVVGSAWKGGLEARVFLVYDGLMLEIREIMPMEMSKAPAPDHIPSTDDARVGNSPMRHAYRVLSDAEKAEVAALKDAGEAFLTLIAARSSSRELAIARTKIEEAVMWAVKDVTGP